MCILNAMEQLPPKTRSRNPRGEGPHLREEILHAASEILAESGRESAVTLRSVARRVGVTAPSIYRHFDSPQAIVMAVAEQEFAILTEQLRIAIDSQQDPVARLFTVCRAYVKFGMGQRDRYRILFERRQSDESISVEPSPSVDRIPGADAFAVLREAMTDCVAAGCSTAISPLEASTQLWLALHGFITLRPATWRFPWPEDDALLESLIFRLAWIEPPSPSVGLEQPEARVTSNPAEVLGTK